MKSIVSSLPKTGLAPEKLFRLMRAAKSADARWRAGRTWSLVYHASEDHSARLFKAYKLFFAENGLSPAAFPSLGRFERDVVKIMVKLLRGDVHACGTMTSGGTESILLGVKTHRDWFRSLHPRVRRCRIIIPASAHPAFFKAANYFDLEAITIPINNDWRLNLGEVAAAINKETALLVASAPSYPFGMIDPIEELGALAKRRGVGLHVDACLGGAFLPFMRRLGHNVPNFDFSVRGVTSISADLHKYGFACKGTSVVLYRDAALRRYQFFVKPDWLGGAYGSPAMLGTRPGGGIASAWAALMMLGESGYVELVGRTLEYRDELWAGIRSIGGLEIVGQPNMSVFCFTSRRHNIFSIASDLEKLGWRIDRQKIPPSIHMIVTPNHRWAVKEFVRDLKAVTAKNRGAARKLAANKGLYGVTNQFSIGKNPVEALYRSIEANY